MRTHTIRNIAATASNTKALQGLRRALQQSSANRVLKRYLPSKFGRHPIYVTASATLEYLLPSPWCFDDALLRFASEYVKADSIVWDIGANVGAFSVAAASIAIHGSTLAVDADPFLVSLLQRTTRHASNHALNIQTLCTAIGAKNGLATFCIARNGRASSFLATAKGRAAAGGSTIQQIVPITTLNALQETFPSPTIIKIDVEGAEMDVLRGGAECIQKHRPVMLIEVGHDCVPQATDLLKEWGYELRSGQLEDFNQPIDLCKTNTIAIPA